MCKTSSPENGVVEDHVASGTRFLTLKLESIYARFPFYSSRDSGDTVNVKR